VARKRSKDSENVLNAPCVDNCTPAEALQYAVLVLEGVADYTSRHCSDCIKNRYRAEQAVMAVKKMLGVPLYRDILPQRAEKLRATVRKLEADARKMLGE
jgi:hypothetical protein